MLNILFLIYSFFPINESTNNFINPYIKIDTPLESQEINNISYKLNINKNLDRNNIKIYNYENQFLGNYKYKFILFSFDYKRKYNYFNYNTNEFNLKQNTKKDDLELKSGILKYNISLKGILNINFHSKDKLKYGVYLNYTFDVKNIKYKIYFSKYEKQDSSLSNLITQNKDFIFPYNYNKKFQLLGFNLNLYNKLKLNFTNTITNIKTLNLPKKDFTIEETSKINEFLLKTQVNFKNYSIYFNYLEKFISADIKNELDNVKFSKFIVKDYNNYSYNLGFIFKRFTTLSIDIFYQKISSYFYGNIESWPFTDDESSWVGGRFNFSSKPEYKRYISRIKNKLSFFNNKLNFIPEIFYDLTIIHPNSKTYEAGFLGMAKQNQIMYNNDISIHLIHLSAKISFKINNLKLNLLLSQVIPISITYTQNTQEEEKINIKNLEGFHLKCSINYKF